MLLHRRYTCTRVSEKPSWIHDGSLTYWMKQNRDTFCQPLLRTRSRVLFLLQPRDKECQGKKKNLNHKQSVEIGHYVGGILWMHHIPKSIHELLYLVRRSKGGVLKTLQGMSDINISAPGLRGGCLLLDGNGSENVFSRAAFSLWRIEILITMAENVTCNSVLMP